MVWFVPPYKVILRFYNIVQPGKGLNFRFLPPTTLYGKARRCDANPACGWISIFRDGGIFSYAHL
jgi:hypothetical protein